MIGSAAPARRKHGSGGGKGGGSFSSSVLSLVLPVFVLMSNSLSVVLANNWNGYVDPTFNCPATTTCPAICVADVADCPADVTCPDGTSLCLDGSCAETCADDELESPCEYDCASVACPQVVDNLDECTARFEGYYDAAAECGAEEEAGVNLLTSTNPVFVFSYVWISVVTVAVLVWCAFNQRWNPIDGSTQPLLEAAKDDDDENVVAATTAVPVDETTKTIDDNDLTWTQTAYKTTIPGTILYGMTVLTLWGFQVALAVLVIIYYMQQEAITRLGPSPIESERQVLLVFEIFWMVGFVFSLTMKWPTSVKSLFLRRCTSDEATHVAVFAPYDQGKGAGASIASKKGTEEERHISCIRRFMDSIRHCVNGVFTTIFSDVHRPKGEGSYVYCPVTKEEDDLQGDASPTTDGTTTTRSFYFRLRRYNHDEESNAFVPGVWRPPATIREFLEHKGGLKSDEIGERRRAIGPNTIRMSKPNFWKEVMREFGQTWYVYQNYLVWTWFPLWYFHMAFVETLVRGTGGFLVAWFKYRNARNLYRLSTVEGDVQVIRDGKVVSLSYRDIVPGDAVRLEPGTTLCDMVIVSADHVLVDESALTGEVSPVAKTEVEVAEGEKRYSSAEHKIHTISAGTTILETCDKSLAIVTKTGSFTAKGELLRDVLSYRRHQFKFDIEVKIVVFILFLYAIFGFVLVLYFLQDDLVYGWFYGMFVVATALPPLLPTVFVVSVGISNDRLSKKRIACTNAEGILVAGKVKVAFFDKTGTLTKQGLDFHSVRSLQQWGEGELSTPGGSLGSGMSVCHSLTTSNDGSLIGNAVDQIMFHSTGATLNYSSDSISVSTGAGDEMKVLKRFEFDHHRMTQSVIVEDVNGNRFVFVKGSPETIKKLCRLDTMPSDIDHVAKTSAKGGLYQIAVAMKDASSLFQVPISVDGVDENDENGPDGAEPSLAVEPTFTARDVSDVGRDEVEMNLSFVGLVNFKNMLREDTPKVLRELREGDVHSIMITGDNVFTGIHIAKESGLISDQKQVIVGHGLSDDGKIKWMDAQTDTPVLFPTLEDLQSEDSNVELAVTGDVWASLLAQSKEYAMELAKSIRIYGRCTPYDKVSVVSTFVDQSYVCLMCGDGGNDCGALKTAHVGIALSSAEASTVSPFTSLDKSISSVTDVLKEGRCALASAFASYKFMIMYGQVESVNQIATAYFYVTFSDWGWVFLDGVWVLSLAFALPLARAAKKLSPERPTSSLLGPHTMCSAIGVFLINFFFLVVVLAVLFRQEWFSCRMWGSTDVSNILVISDNYESAVIFIITGYQFVSSAAAYNFGFTHRSSWFKNYVFVFLFVAFTVVHFVATLVPSTLSCFFRLNCTNDNVTYNVLWELLAIHNPFNTTVMPVGFRWFLVIMMVVNLLLNCGWEYFFVNGLLKKIVRWKKRQNQMALLQNEGEPTASSSEKMNHLELRDGGQLAPSRNFSAGFNQFMKSRDFGGNGIQDVPLPP